jgi:hypothetical protein
MVVGYQAVRVPGPQVIDIADPSLVLHLHAAAHVLGDKQRARAEGSLD